MRCSDVTGFLSFNLCRGKKKCLYFYFFPVSVPMSGLLELVANSQPSGLCSPLCFFCEENDNMKKKGGGEEHYILNCLREIIA